MYSPFTLFRSASILFVAAISLAGCGGGGTGTTDAMDQITTDPMSSTDTAGMSGGSLTTTLSDTLALTSDERLTLTPGIAGTASNFNGANAGAVFTNFPTSGNANYDGSMAMRIGDGTGFLLGSLDLNFSFASGGSATGFLSNIVIDGDPAEGFIVTQGVLNVDVPALDTPEFAGRILGDFDEIGNINSSADSHSLDATFRAAFVEASGLSNEPEIVGNVDGTLESVLGGTRSVEGVFHAERGL